MNKHLKIDKLILMKNQAYEKQKQSLLKSTKTVDNVGGVL